MNSLVVIAVLLVVVSPHALAGSRKGVPGGWQEINDIHNPEVQKLGEFAVSEYNKESKRSLTFVAVVKGERQVVSGMNYKLNVVAADERGAKNNYEAIVWVKSWENFQQLMSFQPIKGRLLGGWQPIEDIHDPEVQKLGKFAVSEYNKESNGSLTFVAVVKGERQVVAGMNYKLNVVAADESGARKNYEAIVWVKPWEKFQQLMSFELIKGRLLGGWQEINDINVPEVQKLGEFAVSEYNKESNRSLTFVAVVKGEKQVVAGMKYKLNVVAADESGAKKNYEAIVWVKAWENFEKLLSFEPIKVVPGGWQAIDDIHDPEVQELGKFAVSEHNKGSNRSLKFMAVEKGETQVVAGINYKLDVAVEEEGARKIYEAIVLVRAWENSKKLTSFKLIKG